tara:strand:- start:149 stop:595 length:447 start_codon:yes stop_codon:yes gene_type:complete
MIVMNYKQFSYSPFLSSSERTYKEQFSIKYPKNKYRTVSRNEFRESNWIKSWPSGKTKSAFSNIPLLSNTYGKTAEFLKPLKKRKLTRLEKKLFKLHKVFKSIEPSSCKAKWNRVINTMVLKYIDKTSTRYLLEQAIKDYLKINKVLI